MDCKKSDWKGNGLEEQASVMSFFREEISFVYVADLVCVDCVDCDALLPNIPIARTMTDILPCLRRSYEAFNLKDTRIARRDVSVCGSGHGERQRMSNRGID